MRKAIIIFFIALLVLTAPVFAQPTCSTPEALIEGLRAQAPSMAVKEADEKTVRAILADVAENGLLLPPVQRVIVLFAPDKPNALFLFIAKDCVVQVVRARADVVWQFFPRERVL